ncbi:MAG TPA: HAMP domain-containing sensor histidine kinase, partial [Streptosporangiaceae bacterium]|nr:HAMP domain-containing sensor histidine kinase [Streptosporangiaceae bacterium]
MSLRLKILASLVGLLAVGLTVFIPGVNLLLRASLTNQLDRELLSSAATMRVLVQSKQELDQVFALSSPYVDKAALLDQSGKLPMFPEGMAVEVRNADGSLLSTNVSLPAFRTTLSHEGIGPPAFPAEMRIGFAFTSGSGDQSYRMFAAGTASGEVIRLAIPMRTVTFTLNELTLIEIVLGVLIVLVGAVLALVMARVTTRPLVRIAGTADAIAGGDLDRRVPDTSPRTEVGRVGLAFNAMLSELQRAMDGLVGSERRMRRLLADASHELATPLTSIRGYAELFRSGATTDVDKVLGRIECEATRMGRLVDDLLLLADLDEGRPLRPERVDLAVLAAEAVDDARVRAPDRLIELDTDGPAWVDGEPDRLRQVVANLLSNAGKHTPPGTT